MLTERVGSPRAATRTSPFGAGHQQGNQAKPESQPRNLSVAAHAVKRYRCATDARRAHSRWSRRRRFPLAEIVVYVAFTACVVGLIGLACAALWLVAP